MNKKAAHVEFFSLHMISSSSGNAASSTTFEVDDSGYIILAYHNEKIPIT
jgi:hypothetical protein